MLAAWNIASQARAHFAGNREMPSDDEIWSWIDNVRDCIYQAAQNRGRHPRDFAATLIGAFSSGPETVIAHIGDGAAVGRCAETGEWISLSWPHHGEYASSTFFITDQPTFQLRITRHSEPLSAIAVLTDGLERLALDLALKRPHAPFFDGIVRPLLGSKAIGIDLALSRSLALFLDSDAVNARTDDDKTLVVGVRQ